MLSSTMSLLDRIADCSQFTPADYRPFVVAGHALGHVRHSFAEILREFPDIFVVADDGIGLADDLATPAMRTAAVADVLATLRDRGVIKGWRGEPYPVSTGFYDEPLLIIERAAAIHFGTMAYGVNVNGYILRDDTIFMWIARRSETKPVAPGKLDHLVAGGQPTNISVADNLIKECAEEAGLPASLAAQAVPVGTMSYVTERAGGLRHSLFFNFDLLLDEDVLPENTDGEVSEFRLWSMEDVIARMRETEEFKFDVPLGILDFAVRHGILGPDDRDYIRICEAIRLGSAGRISAR